jgi:hypothetical protein
VWLSLLSAVAVLHARMYGTVGESPYAPSKENDHDADDGVTGGGSYRLAHGQLRDQLSRQSKRRRSDCSLHYPECTGTVEVHGAAL